MVSGDRECWGAYYNLGTSYKNLRQYDKAIAALKAAVEIDPNMLFMQGEAFLQKLKRLNQQASDVLSDGGIPLRIGLDELYLQWQESQTIGEALAQIIEGLTDDELIVTRPAQDIVPGLHVSTVLP